MNKKQSFLEKKRSRILYKSWMKIFNFARSKYKLTNETIVKVKIDGFETPCIATRR